MTIEITRPEVEALIQQRLKSGVFANAEDVILHALRSSDPGRPAAPAEGPLRTAADIVLRRMRGVPSEAEGGMPTDGASQHDHYIYGTAKIEQ